MKNTYKILIAATLVVGLSYAQLTSAAIYNPSSASGTITSGTAGQLGFYNSTGTTIVGTSSDPLYVGSLVSTSASNASSFNANVGLAAGTKLLYNSILGFTASTTIYDYCIGNNSCKNGVFTNGSAGDNVAIGDGALGSLTTGFENYAIGQNAANALTTSSGNFALGGYALSSLTSGATGNNVAIGPGALQFATGDSGRNVAIGQATLQGHGTIFLNVGIGWNALSVVTGNANTALGDTSCGTVTTGTNNTCVGQQAGGGSGFGPTTGSNNTFIGQNASFTNSTQRSNATAIGYNSTVGCSNCMSLGTNTLNGFGSTSPSVMLSVATSTANASSTLSLGRNGNTVGGGAFELQRTDGSWVCAYIPAGATTFTIVAGNCPR